MLTLAYIRLALLAKEEDTKSLFFSLYIAASSIIREVQRKEFEGQEQNDRLFHGEHSDGLSSIGRNFWNSLVYLTVESAASASKHRSESGLLRFSFINHTCRVTYLKMTEMLRNF